MASVKGEFARVGAHSHVKGLGLVGLSAKPVRDGMVGQTKAREAAGIVVKMIREGKMAGRAILLAGPPGTGKTAIAVAITRELGKDVPFVAMTGPDVFSAEVKKTEVLMRNIRRAIGVRIHEMRTIYEGEVAGLKMNMTKSPYNPYEQVPESAEITLSTKDDSRTFSVGQSVAINLIRQGVGVGNIVQIDAETGRVTNLGQSKEAPGKRHEISGVKIIPRPSGSIKKEKEFVYVLSIDDLDEMQAKRGGLMTMFFGGERAEIDSTIRQRVDETVKGMVKEEKAEIIPGVLFLDDIHMLDIEAYSFLARAMESDLAPIIILASNRGITKIRGTDVISPHGMPLDLLDRVLIISTEMYSADEIKKILEIRAREEDVKMRAEALDYLTQLGVKTSLRHVVQLLTPANETAKEEGRKEVTKEDVDRVHTLFSDVKRSVDELRKYEEYYMK